ncbi:hypothetical protein L2E82_30735 [Cichorium intybus]|uniref:Uncharacterized protein n=1 Tax=Cichorium intybus TaxID=13427 RepID=A0ACB9D1W7_CICIN|nr:hypothetical protein L2E82_30735 [Cichorium intybus]
MLKNQKKSHDARSMVAIKSPSFTNLQPTQLSQTCGLGDCELASPGNTTGKPIFSLPTLLPDHRTGAAVPSLPSPPTSYLSSSIRSAPTPPVIKKKWIKSAICSGVDDIRFISF